MDGQAQIVKEPQWHQKVRQELLLVAVAGAVVDGLVLFVECCCCCYEFLMPQQVAQSCYCRLAAPEMRAIAWAGTDLEVVMQWCS